MLNRLARKKNIPIEVKAVMMLIEQNKPRTAFDLYRLTANDPREPQLLFEEFQLIDIKTILFGMVEIVNGKRKLVKPQEYMLLRCRNGSKTRDSTFMTVFMGYMKNNGGKFNRVLWYSAADDQLKIVRKYFDTNRYVKEVTREKLILWNGNEIELKIMTRKQAQSSRSDITIYDEQQEMDHHFYNLSKGTGLEKDAGRKIHLGTTAMDSVLHKNYMRLQPKGWVSTHTIDDCVWLDKERALEEFAYEPQWYIDSQLYCKWVRPGGRVFERVEERTIPNWLQHTTEISFGSDPNPKSGHGLVGVAFITLPENPHEKIIYIFDSRELINDTENYVIAASRVIDQWCRDRRFNGIEIESQFGEELHSLIRNISDTHRKYVFTKTWDEKSKQKRIEFIRMHQVYYQKGIDRELITQISGASWDEKSPRPKLAKSPDQHKLDSFIHACHQRSLNIVKLAKGSR